MSNSTEQTAPQAVRLEDVIALHREIAALVRAGIPLELGLRGFAMGLPTRLGRLANRIAGRLNQGQSLAEAVESEGPGESSIYSSVISAGVRSGKLAEALEALAASSEQVQETRRQATLALVYPTAVTVLACLLSAFLIQEIIPRYIFVADDFNFSDEMAFRCLHWIHAHESLLVYLALPLGAMGFLFGTGLLIRSLGGFGLGTMFRLLNQAQFAEILKIQIEYGLPLPEAFVRAANCTTDSRLRNAAKSIAQELNQGVPFPQAISRRLEIPPMMRWILASGVRQGTLVDSLALMRDSYRRRALRCARFLKIWLPIFMTVCVAGTIAFLYGLFFFTVLASFWEGLLRE